MVPLTTVKERTSNFTIYLYCNIVYFVASMCDSVVARRVDLPGAGRRLAGSVRVCRVSRILRIFHTITVHTVLVLNTVINLNSNCRGSSWITWKRNNNRPPNKPRSTRNSDSHQFAAVVLVVITVATTRVSTHAIPGPSESPSFAKLSKTFPRP